MTFTWANFRLSYLNMASHLLLINQVTETGEMERIPTVGGCDLQNQEIGLIFL